MIRLTLFALTILAAMWSVRAQANTEDLERIRSAARDFAWSQHGRNPALVVEAGALDTRLQLPACPAALATALAPGSRELGPVTVSVRCPGPKPWTVYVPVRVQQFIEVLVAARPLARGEEIRAQDVSLVRQEVSMVSGGYLTDPAELAGKRLKRPLAPGALLSPQALESPPVVRRGQSVTILARNNGFEVRMAGEALNDAAPGEPVRVRNLHTKKVVEGTVLRTGTVQVAL
jgi:flagella basal body P-ring formation protein FlgA